MKTKKETVPDSKQMIELFNGYAKNGWLFTLKMT